MIRLARQLGPWADEEQSIPVGQEEIQVERDGRRPMPMRLYRHPGRAHRSSLFLVPGFHFKGPDHPGIHRLATIFANAGYLVCVPFLEDFMALRLRPSVIDDAVLGFTEFLGHSPKVKPVVMCISFGTLPALGIAAAESLRDSVGGVVTFGGYLEWRPTMRYCLFEEPLSETNYPVVFNLLSGQWKDEVDISVVVGAWDRYIHASWDQPEIEEEEFRRKVANGIGEDLPPDERRLFLQGCGLEEGWEERAKRALEKTTGLDWIDNDWRIQDMTSPLLAVHGAGDVISPPSQSLRLAGLCSTDQRASAFITGIYGHSGKDENARSGMRAQAEEALKMVRILRELVGMSTTPR